MGINPNSTSPASNSDNLIFNAFFSDSSNLSLYLINNCRKMQI